MHKELTLEGEHDRLKGREGERERERGRGRDCGGLAFEQEQERVAGLLEKEGVSSLVIGNPKCLQLGWRVKEGFPAGGGQLPPISSNAGLCFCEARSGQERSGGTLFV